MNRIFAAFAVFGTIVIASPKEGQGASQNRCFEYLEEFRGLASLVKPHLTGIGFVSHDPSAIVRRYKLTTDSLSSRTCKQILEFLPVDSVEQRRALEEARRMHFVLENLGTIE